MMKIALLDLDGCLCKYPDDWIKFVNEKTNNSFSKLNMIKEVIPFQKYKDLKMDYRTSGIKANIEMVKGADTFVKKLRDSGYIIIILTARPIYEIPEVFRDTLFWLRKNKIEHDLLFYGKSKHINILKYFPNISFMVEDNAKMANQVAKLGYKVYVLDNEYNRQKLEKNCSRVFSLEEILKSEVIE